MEDYYFIFEGERFEVESPTIESIVKIFNDMGLNEPVEDAVHSIPYRYEPCGKTQNNNLYDTIVQESSEILRKRYSSQNIVLYNNNGIEEKTISLVNIYIELLIHREGCEWGTVDETDLKLHKLKCFLNKGKWHFGLRSQDGKILTNHCEWLKPEDKDNLASWRLGGSELIPIVWFGLDDDPPIDCWTLFREGWNDFWFNEYSDAFIYDCCFKNGDWISEYWIAECGMDVPYEEFKKVRNNCPILLNSDDSDDELINKIVSFIYSKHKELIKLKYEQTR